LSVSELFTCLDPDTDPEPKLSSKLDPDTDRIQNYYKLLKVITPKLFSVSCRCSPFGSQEMVTRLAEMSLTWSAWTA
jgi:hypothetical protein